MFHRFRHPLIALGLSATLLAPAAAAWRPNAPVKALLVGIDYGQPGNPWGGPGFALHGTTDLATMEDTLKERKVADIRVLADGQATSQAIRDGLLKLAADAQPGDNLLFYYSGHGFVVGDDDGDEKAFDRLDECIIPVDTPDPASPTDAAYGAAVVRDDFIEARLAEMVQAVRKDGAEGSVTFIFDSCHSGSLSRNGLASGARPKTLPPLLQKWRAMMAASGDKQEEGFLRGHKAGDRGWVVLGAARAEQEALDTPQGGLFTLSLVDALAEGSTQAGAPDKLRDYATWRDLMLVVSNRVNNQPLSAGSQTPQMTGDPALAVLSGTRRPERSSELEVLRTDEEGARVQLNRGALAGLYPGTRVAISAPGQAQPLATAVVEDGQTGEQLLQAWCKVENPKAGLSDQLVGGTVSVLDQNFGDVRLKLYFAGDKGWTGLAAAWRDHLAKDMKEIVQIAPSREQADMVVWAQDDQGRTGQLFFESRGASSGPRGQAVSVVALAQTDQARLDEQLKALTRRSLMQRTVSKANLVSLQLTPGQFSGDPDGPLVDYLKTFKPTPEIDLTGTVSNGQSCLARVTNNSGKPLFISVVNVTGDGQLNVLYPTPREMGDWQAVGPGSFVEFDVGFGQQKPQGSGIYMDGIKVIATENFAFDPLALQTGGQTRSRKGAPPPKTAFSDFFSEALFPGTGPKTRAFRPSGKEAGLYVLTDVRWVRVALP